MNLTPSYSCPCVAPPTLTLGWRVTLVTSAHNSVGRTDRVGLLNCKMQGKGMAGNCDIISSVISRQLSALGPF